MNYYKIKKVIQISIDAFDYFGFNEFMYNVYFMEEKYKVIENKDIHKIHLNLDYLHHIDYNEIVSGDNKLMKDLYFLTCDDNERIKNVYEKDELMKEIMNEAKQIAGIEKMHLYLTDEELHKQDQEQDYEMGMADGMDKGIEKKQQEVVLNMLEEKISLETIAKCTDLSLKEVKRIIEESKK